MPRQLVHLALDEREMQVLTRLAHRLGVSRTQLLRWALRYYALTGPWHIPGGPGREVVIGALGPMDVGPLQQGAL